MLCGLEAPMCKYTLETNIGIFVINSYKGMRRIFVGIWKQKLSMTLTLTQTETASDVIVYFPELT